MRNIEKMVDAYLETKTLAWSPVTMRNEACTLRSMQTHLTGQPSRLWKWMTGQGLAPYSRVTYWTRVCDFWDYVIGQGLASAPNVYREFRNKNERLFKYAYQRKTPEITFEEASRRIGTIADESIRNKAIQLLSGGLRWSESGTIRDGAVIGKGGKPRRVYTAEVSGHVFAGQYHTFRRALAKVGLKPHDLRKLCATKLAKEGFKEADLTEAMGWSSIVTAASYLAPIREAEMRDKFKRIHAAMNAPQGVTLSESNASHGAAATQSVPGVLSKQSA